LLNGTMVIVGEACLTKVIVNGTMVIAGEACITKVIGVHVLIL